MIYIRSLVYNILFFGLIAFACCFTSIIFFAPINIIIVFWNYFIIPSGRFLLKIICGLDIEIRGAEYIKQAGVIYAVKHESSLETYIFTSIIRRAVFILKKELTYIPIFGWAQALYGMVNVDRSSGGAAMKKMLSDVKKAMTNNRPLIIFPEGTRVKPGTVKGYKPGIFFIADNLKVPVIPVALNTGLFWRKNSFLRYPGKVIIEFLPPMPQNLDKKEFMEELEFRIENKCKELNNESIQKYPNISRFLEGN